MIIVDTSIWVDALNGRATREVEVLSELISENREVCLTPTILQETLQGIKMDEDFERLKYRLGGFQLLLLHPEESSINAAGLYREMRKKGVTIRKSNDCLIAIYALGFNAKIFHRDRDFDLISKHSSLQIFRP